MEKRGSISSGKQPIFSIDNELHPKLSLANSDFAPSESSSPNALTTPWRSIWIVVLMQFLLGINISIYYMSMWPYLSAIDTTADIHFLGFVIAACSLGCSVANPLFGWWHQKTFSTTRPTMLGFTASAIGQLWYGLLPSIHSNPKWQMMAARFVTGCGAGSLSVLRAYVSTATLPKDRLKAVSVSTAACVLGMSAGPVIQACFTPLGSSGLSQPHHFVLDMYTAPAYVMVIINFSAVIIMGVFFKEIYAGILGHDNNSKKVDEIVHIPKFDRAAAGVCIVIWVLNSIVATNVEVISSPVTMAFYTWNDDHAVLINGILESLACVVSVVVYMLLAYTKVGEIDKRKLIFVGLVLFAVYHICNLPMPFYSGPLKYKSSNSSSAGGCDPSYHWCSSDVRTPIWLYIFCFVVVNGIAFPLVGSPNGTLFSEVLGPRNQGTMQGAYSFFGSFAQFLSPILVTILFQSSGYKYVMVTQLGLLSITIILFVIVYKRMVPLEMQSIDNKEDGELDSNDNCCKL